MGTHCWVSPQRSLVCGFALAVIVGLVGIAPLSPAADAQILAGQPFLALESTRLNSIDPWLANAIRTQHDIAIGEDVAIDSLTWLGSHNSFNSLARFNVVSNQLYTVYDQLRLGVRALDYDVHYLDSTGDLHLCYNSPDLKTACDQAIGVCQFLGLPDLGADHTGCLNISTLYSEGLHEIQLWLDGSISSESFDLPRFLIVYLDLFVEGQTSLLVNQTRAAFNVSTIFLPSEKDVHFPTRWPSLSDLFALGKRIMFVHTGGTQRLQDLIFSGSELRTPHLHEKWFTGYDQCQSSTADDGPVSPIARDWAVMFGSELVVKITNITTEESARLGTVTAPLGAGATMCGVSPLFDNFNVTKAIASVWSWQRGHPTFSRSRNCAAVNRQAFPNATLLSPAGVNATIGSDFGIGTWNELSCDNQLPYACRRAGVRTGNVKSAGEASSLWQISGAVGTWERGWTNCPADYEFAIPTGAYENALLLQQMERFSASAVWIKLSDSVAEGCWTTSDEAYSCTPLVF